MLLAFEELQAGDLAFHRAMAPGQGESRGDRGQVLLQLAGEAGHRIAVGGRRDPSLQVTAPALPDHGEKGLGQPLCLRDMGVHLTELVQRGLRLRGPLGHPADHHKRHRPSGRPLGAGFVSDTCLYTSRTVWRVSVNLGHHARDCFSCT